MPSRRRSASGQDETRLGLKTIEHRKLTAFGVKPVGLGQWQRQTYYLYGVVEPKTGESFFYEFSHLDTDCFAEFLKLFSRAYPQDLHIIQLDNGSFHTTQKLSIPLFFWGEDSPKKTATEHGLIFSTSSLSSDVLGGRFPPKARTRTQSD